MKWFINQFFCTNALVNSLIMQSETSSFVTAHGHYDNSETLIYLAACFWTVGGIWSTCTNPEHTQGECTTFTNTELAVEFNHTTLDVWNNRVTTASLWEALSYIRFYLKAMIDT